MIGLRTKLTLGFGSILVIVAGIGMLIMTQLSSLGESIDVILRENYRSVVACQNMKEALERIDSGILNMLSDNWILGDSLIHNNLVVFEKALENEKNNITLPGEQVLVDTLSQEVSSYFAIVDSIKDSRLTIVDRKALYYSRALPLFLKTKDQAQKILVLNQDNMNQANNIARKQATSAKNRMLLVIIVCGLMALAFSFLTKIWVLHPLNRLIESVGEISAGNLELVLHSSSKDEIGLLANAFNHMTQVLRERKRSDNINLQRTQLATKEVFSSLSSAIAVTDVDGIIEISTESAQKLFGLEVGSSIYNTSHKWLPELYKKATFDGTIIEYPVHSGYLQVFVDFKEYFYQPVVLPLSINNHMDGPTGAVILFRDMTLIHEQQELKQSVISTVSHQLKTPLTSLRMSIHLLLDERLGSLTDKQMELLQAAQDESERLEGIVEDLLDIHRINKDQQLLDMKITNPETLVRESVFPLISEIKDRGIDLITNIPDNLPFVEVDITRFAHVFVNIITNAMRYTSAGGSITITAKVVRERVRFIIADTGIGISPEHIGHVFEQFFRVPNVEKTKGAGLGLAIAKEIVQAHGGEIVVESELNKGSTFWFELPAINNNPSKFTINKGVE